VTKANEIYCPEPRTDWSLATQIAQRLRRFLKPKPKGPKNLHMAKDIGMSEQEFENQRLKLPSQEWTHPRF
jgi:hypothetical protein